MVTFFGLNMDQLTLALLLITGAIIVGVTILALSNAIFFKIGIRNIPRRRIQMVLIVFALMLSTTLLTSVLATGDVLTATVQTVAVFNWGMVDEVIEGGHGDLGVYRQRVYSNLLKRTQHDPNIAALGAGLRERGLLIADQTSRQVRSNVTALGVLPGSEQGFGGMINQGTKRRVAISDLAPDQVYVNLTVAQLLNAHAGDTLYLYSQRWSGKRYVLRVAAIVGNDGLVGDSPTLLGHLQTFQNIEGLSGQINQIFVANRGSAANSLGGLALTDTITTTLRHYIPRYVHVVKVKAEGVESSQRAQDIFSRIFTLFALFALAIGLLLIFLIFILLAAERRTEMGIARAIGVQRRHLILMYLFEGTVYDLISSFVGLLAGVGVGALLMYVLGPILARFDFPLKPTFQPRSMIIAYCLGVIFTFCSVVLSSWLVSRMSVVEALRDLPEAPRTAPSPRELLSSVSSLWGSSHTKRLKFGQRIRHALLEQIPEIVLGCVWLLTSLGPLPLLAGVWLMHIGLVQAVIIPFSCGFSLIVLGIVLLLKAIIERIIWFVRRDVLEQHVRTLQRIAGSIVAALIGTALLAYWALPFDILARLGLPRFQGGIELFFIAGFMMILGAVWALVANAGLFIRPLLALCSRFTGLYTLMKLALAYPLQRRFRMGMSVMMFSLVVFAMTVMAIITNAMQRSYVDINTQTGGYDIQATAYFKPLPDLRSSLEQHGVSPKAFSAIGVRDTTAVGIIQLSATAPRWYLYPAQVVDGGFLNGYGLHLTARATQFASDSAVWQALQTHPDYALIDSSALRDRPHGVLNSIVYDPAVPLEQDTGVPTIPPDLDAREVFALSGVYQGDNTFSATPVWVVGLQGREAVKLTIIGVVDNSDSAHFGLYIPRATYSSNSIGTVVTNETPMTESYYFKVAPGQDKRQLALALGSAFLDDGLETTVLEDAIWQVRGPRIFLSNVLLGIVGMTLLLGVAALAITGTRAVIERRQQIGMLRALGCPRHLIQGAFLLESFFVGLLGSLLGVILGVILARNIFAANFFEQYQTGLYFSVPWQQLALIIGVALLASFLGALLPAWQAGRVAPAEALRYQ